MQVETLTPSFLEELYGEACGRYVMEMEGRGGGGEKTDIKPEKKTLTTEITIFYFYFTTLSIVFTIVCLFSLGGSASYCGGFM